MKEKLKNLGKKDIPAGEIGIKLGFSHKQMRNYFYRHNVEQRKVAARLAIKRKGRPPKDYLKTKDKDKYALKSKKFLTFSTYIRADKVIAEY